MFPVAQWGLGLRASPKRAARAVRPTCCVAHLPPQVLCEQALMEEVLAEWGRRHGLDARAHELHAPQPEPQPDRMAQGRTDQAGMRHEGGGGVAAGGIKVQGVGGV